MTTGIQGREVYLGLWVLGLPSREVQTSSVGDKVSQKAFKWVTLRTRTDTEEIAK